MMIKKSKTSGHIQLLFGTEEGDVFKATFNICKKIMKASNERHKVLQKMKEIILIEEERTKRIIEGEKE